MSRGKPRVVVTIPRELMKLSKEQQNRLRDLFSSALANVVGAQAFAGDDGDMLPSLDNNPQVSSGTAKKRAKKGTKKGGGEGSPNT